MSTPPRSIRRHARLASRRRGARTPLPFDRPAGPLARGRRVRPPPVGFCRRQVQVGVSHASRCAHARSPASPASHPPATRRPEFPNDAQYLTKKRTEAGGGAPPDPPGRPGLFPVGQVLNIVEEFRDMSASLLVDAPPARGAPRRGARGAHRREGAGDLTSRRPSHRAGTPAGRPSGASHRATARGPRAVATSRRRSASARSAACRGTAWEWRPVWSHWRASALHQPGFVAGRRARLK